MSGNYPWGLSKRCQKHGWAAASRIFSWCYIISVSVHSKEPNPVMFAGYIFRVMSRHHQLFFKHKLYHIILNRTQTRFAEQTQMTAVLFCSKTKVSTGPCLNVRCLWCAARSWTCAKRCRRTIRPKSSSTCHPWLSRRPANCRWVVAYELWLTISHSTSIIESLSSLGVKPIVGTLSHIPLTS